MLWNYYATEDFLSRLRSLKGQYAAPPPHPHSSTLQIYILYAAIFNSPAICMCFLKLLKRLHPTFYTVAGETGSFS